MTLQNGTIVKFKCYIDEDYNNRSKTNQEKHDEFMRNIEGKIATICGSYLDENTNTTYYVVEEYNGNAFPLSYFECVIPTINIENPRKYLVNECIVILKNENILIYNNGKFYKEYNPIITLDQYNEYLEFGYGENRNDKYDIIQIYSDWTTSELIWER